MTPKGETRIALVFTAIILALIALTFVGCKTPKTVTETITEYVHDTVQVVKADTVVDVRIKVQVDTLTVHLTDTVRESETHTYTVNEAGDTIKEVHLVKEKEIYHHTIEERTIIVDSTNRYKATIDSLRASLHEAKSKEKVVVKTKYILRWWEWGIIGLLAVAILADGIIRSIKKF